MDPYPSHHRLSNPMLINYLYSLHRIQYVNRESFNNPMTFGGKDGPLGSALGKKGTSQITDSALKDLHQVEYKSSIISNSNKSQGQQ